MKISRTINTYEVEAYHMSLTGNAVFLGKTTYQSTRYSRSEARYYLEKVCIVPKGAIITYNVIDTAKYVCTLEEFLAVAHII